MRRLVALVSGAFLVGLLLGPAAAGPGWRTPAEASSSG
jgi:hypothetical protein